MLALLLLASCTASYAQQDNGTGRRGNATAAGSIVPIAAHIEPLQAEPGSYRQSAATVEVVKAEPEVPTARPTAGILASSGIAAQAVHLVASAATTQVSLPATAGATAGVERATATPAPAQVPQAVAKGNINVRRGPGANYPVVGGLEAGAACAVSGRNQDATWLEVSCGGAPGWVFAGLVTFGGPLQQVPFPAKIPAPPPTVPSTPRPAPTWVPPPPDPVVADLVARINKARADAGLNELAWAPELGAAASEHAGDMAAHNFFSHTGSDGSDVSARMRRAGYQPAYWGEILTHVNGGADAAFGQYWGSPHHHDVILGDKFRDIGVAWVRDPHDGYFNYYVVVFGRR